MTAFHIDSAHPMCCIGMGCICFSIQYNRQYEKRNLRWMLLGEANTCPRISRKNLQAIFTMV